VTVRGALQAGAASLRAKSIDTPYLDATLLLAEALGTTKERLFAAYSDEIAIEQAERFQRLLGERLSGRPVSYIRRRKEFYGREFYVDERVLVPRPDTEILVEAALGIIDAREQGVAVANAGEPRGGSIETGAGSGRRIARVHDVGTGSGCIALTLALERPRLAVSASDLSPGAEEVLRLNASRLKVDLPFFRRSLLSGIPGPFDMIVSNPPYLTDAEVDEMIGAGWPEPPEALRGGPEGLDCIEQLVAQSVDCLVRDSYLLLECAPQQAERIAGMLLAAGFGSAEVLPDLAGRGRVVVGRLLGAESAEQA